MWATRTNGLVGAALYSVFNGMCTAEAGARDAALLSLIVVGFGLVSYFLALRIHAAEQKWQQREKCSALLDGGHCSGL